MDIRFQIEFKAWFDYCPAEGSSKFGSDKSCLCHYKIIERPDDVYLVRKPNFKEEMDPYYKFFLFGRTEKSMLPAMVEANNSTYLYKINLDNPVTADDMVAIGIQTPIIDTPVKNDRECNDLMKDGGRIPAYQPGSVI